MQNNRHTNSFDTTGRHHIPPLAKPPPSYCLTANLQCTYQSYKSLYTTPNCVNKMQKPKQKAYKDSQANVKHHSIQVNDKVPLLQHQSKTKSRYDPVPYKVIKVQGTQITATRGDQVRQRDAKKFKKVYTFPPTNYRRGRCPIVAHRDTPMTLIVISLPTT